MKHGKQAVALLSAILCSQLLGIPAMGGEAGGGEVPLLEELKAEAQHTWMNRRTVEDIRASIRLYWKILKVDPKDGRSWADLSKAFFWLAEDESTPGQMKVKYYRRGVKAARKAQEMAPDDPAGYFWEGANIASIGKMEGIISNVGKLPGLMSLMRKVESLDERFYFGAVHRFWSKVILETPWIIRKAKGVTIHDSVEHARKAVRLEPRFLLSHLFLAEALIEAEEKEKARGALEHILQQEEGILPGFRAENRFAKKKAKEVLQSIGGR